MQENNEEEGNKEGFEDKAAPTPVDDLNRLCTYLNQLDALSDPILNEFFTYLLNDKNATNYVGGLTGLRQIYCLPTATPQAALGRQALNNYQARFFAERERVTQRNFQNQVRTSFSQQRQKIDEFILNQENSLRGIGLRIVELIEEMINDFADTNNNDLNGRFEELKQLLNEQAVRIQRIIDSLLQTAEQIDKNFKEINVNLEELNEKIKKLEEFLQTWKKRLEEDINGLIETVRDSKTRLDTFYKEFLDWTQKWETFATTVKSALEDLKKRLNSLEDNLKKVQDVLNEVKQTCATIKTNVDSILNDVTRIKTDTGQIKGDTTDIKAETGRIYRALTDFATNTTQNLEAIKNEQRRHAIAVEEGFQGRCIVAFELIETTLAGLETTIVQTTGEINALVGSEHYFTRQAIVDNRVSIQKKLDELKKQLDSIESNAIKRQKNTDTKIDKFWENNKETILDETTKNICENIVGQSYIKWDATNSFYPTLVFKFTNKNENSLKKQSQISTRLPIKADEINDNFIQILKDKIAMNSGLFYRSGNVRLNYVNVAKSWKTTLFTETKEAGIQLLEKLSQLIDDPFKLEQVSVTQRATRQSITRRSAALWGIETNTPEDYSIGTMTLQKVYLQINGLKKQIILSK